MLSSISLSLLLKYIAPIFVGQSQPEVLVNLVKDAWSAQLETVKKVAKAAAGARERQQFFMLCKTLCTAITYQLGPHNQHP